MDETTTTTQSSFHEATIVSQDGSVRTLKVPVVQELARHGIKDVPKMFLRPPLDTLNTCFTENFPSISMAKLRANDVEAKENELRKLGQGFGEFGMVLVSPKESTHGLNVWPQNPTNFREVIESYAEKATELVDDILEALAEALSLDEKAFVKYFDPKSREINARINYYPPCPKPKLTMGLSPHTDATILTLLMQFDISGGLQVMHKDKNIWFSVPWPNDALLVNVGDLLEIMSNGKVQSSWHRAVTQVDLERFSLALFFNPPLSMEIEPIKSDDSSDYEYKKVVVGDYLQHLYKVSPTLSKVAIKYAMV
ncbi:flavanone 3-dioxygenase 2 isoform X2 [Spinacia oleracea]|uniref:Flavanone 3-dioxygenase 2 isoform X2 n=1 Tax=Spinacia oleracea TaxID=3562 RepID=A0ABM3RUC2_SPIOL|nr:flavanone 3-dioxygenase 2-like isoform X2 [Spinacia oleracea]